MSKNKLILVGGGGHCKSCIDVIEQEDRFEIVGILDIPSKMGNQILGYEIIGTDDDYEKFHQQGCTFLITVGQIKTAAVRKKIFEKLNKINANFATIIAPTATVSKHAMIGKGTIVMHHAFVNAGAKIGENCILNSNCFEENRRLVKVVQSPYEAAEDAHAIAVLTEWDEFREYDYQNVYAKMQKPAFVFDGRNILNTESLISLGFNLVTIGKGKNQF